MQVIDLTFPMTNDMPVFPGSGRVAFRQIADNATHGYNEKRIELDAHTGTHIDCKKHLFPAGFDTSSEPERFSGKGLVIDCHLLSGEIERAHLLPYEKRIREVDFVLLYTGNDQHWGSGEYFQRFPVLSCQSALFLKDCGLKGIGIDAPSFDRVESKDLSIHKILLSESLVLIENLTNLQLLNGVSFLFLCLPLKIIDGDGSPVRAVAITEIK